MGSMYDPANDPDEAPPDGVAFVVDSDGTTRIPLAYERVYYSMNLTTIDRVKALLATLLVAATVVAGLGDVGAGVGGVRASHGAGGDLGSVGAGHGPGGDDGSVGAG